MPKARDLAPLMHSASRDSTANSAGSTPPRPSRICGGSPDAYPEGGVRLHRRRGRRRLRSSVRDKRSATSSFTPPSCATSPPSGPARRCWADRWRSVRHRADRFHPADAHRGRDGRCPGGRADYPVLAVHPGHRVDRGRCGRNPVGTQLVSAVHVARSGPVDAACQPAAEAGFDTLLVTVHFRSRGHGFETSAMACRFRRS